MSKTNAKQLKLKVGEGEVLEFKLSRYTPVLINISDDTYESIMKVLEEYHTTIKRFKLRYGIDFGSDYETLNDFILDSILRTLQDIEKSYVDEGEGSMGMMALEKFILHAMSYRSELIKHRVMYFKNQEVNFQNLHEVICSEEDEDEDDSWEDSEYE